jgi:hypothetical protein
VEFCVRLLGGEDRHHRGHEVEPARHDLMIELLTLVEKAWLNRPCIAPKFPLR